MVPAANDPVGILAFLQAIKKVAEMLLKPRLTGTYFQLLSTTFSARGPVVWGLFGGAGGI